MPKPSLAHFETEPALPQLLTVPEVAAWVRVSPKTVYRWIKDGKLKALQFGSRLYRVEPDAVRQFLQISGYGNVPAPQSLYLSEH